PACVRWAESCLPHRRTQPGCRAYASDPLTRKVVDLLLALKVRQGRVVGRDELLHAVWGDRAVTDEPLTHPTPTTAVLARMGARASAFGGVRALRAPAVGGARPSRRRSSEAPKDPGIVADIATVQG